MQNICALTQQAAISLFYILYFDKAYNQTDILLQATELNRQ